MIERLQFSISDGQIRLNDSSVQEVHEDRTYRIEVTSPIEWGRPTAFIEDYSLGTPDEELTVSGRVVWKWEAMDYFRNCFGLTRFSVEFPDGNSFVSSYFEVLSKKIPPEEILSMIHYLQSRSERIIQAGFSKAGLGLETGESLSSIERTVQIAEESIKAIEDLLVVRPLRIRRRLIEERLVKSYDLSDPVDDRSITYILENMERGSSEPDLAQHSLPVDVQGRRLYFTDLDVVTKREFTDVYENRIIHGFLKSMLHRLEDINAYLQNIYEEVGRLYSEHSMASEGYISLLSVCGYHVGRLSRHSIEHINRLLARIRTNEWRAQQLIPARPVVEMPRNTPWFSVYPRYRRIYMNAQKWYTTRDEFSDLSHLLLHLKTIDRLYEYVCLFQLLDLFEGEGWQLYETKMMGRSGLQRGELNDRYCFRSTLGELELLYEPRIPPRGERDPLWNLVKISGSPVRPFTPDFLVRIKHQATGKTSYIALDAKYGSENSIYKYHLPEVVLKYTYGVARLDNLSKPPFRHTWILAPLTGVQNYQRYLPEAGYRHATIGVIGILPQTGRESLREWYREVVLKSFAYS